MVNWAEIPNAAIVKIASRVKVIKDFVAFRAVCTSWRIATRKDDFHLFSPQIPLLMLADKADDDFREFYSLYKKKVSSLFLPEVRGRECFPSQGWICTVAYNGEINLLNPFSRAQIQLPPEINLWALNGYDELGSKEEKWHYMDKAILSASPSVTSDYVLVVNYFAGKPCLAFWRPGDLNWTKIHMREDGANFPIGAAAAMICYRGKFYCVTWNGQIWCFDVPGPNIPQPIVEPQLVIWHEEDDTFKQPSVQHYLVELSGALLFVCRYSHGGGCQTYKFKVYEIDVTNRKLKEINTLGDSALFLALNESTSFDSSKFMGVKSNHIYFTDDWHEVKNQECGGGRDMGAYNLEDGKIESFYPGLSLSCFSPPISQPCFHSSQFRSTWLCSYQRGIHACLHLKDKTFLLLHFFIIPDLLQSKWSQEWISMKLWNRLVVEHLCSNFSASQTGEKEVCAKEDSFG